MDRDQLQVFGAAEHNLRDVDIEFGGGVTVIVGVSGSGKSSLAFDVIYHEARRRFVESLALGRVTGGMRAARVRKVVGLRPAVAVGQNVLNRNPASTVASSVGLHPFLRILYSRFAAVECPSCGNPVRKLAREERLAFALERLEDESEVDVDVALVRDVVGSHARLLSGLRGMFGTVVVDGAIWAARPSSAVPVLAPDQRHEIVVRVGRLSADSSPADVRATLALADELGSPEVRLGGVALLRAPICPRCGLWVRPLEPADFRIGGPDTSSHRVAGRTITEFLSHPVGEVLEILKAEPAHDRSARVRSEIIRRLRALGTLGLDYLALDRPMPTLSRGEAQRTRLAVMLSGRLQDFLHVLDEPTIGLHDTDRRRLLDAIAELQGPVLMVEHDRAAVAAADDVVEIGPEGGNAGGRLVFQGPPAALWASGTPSGQGFSSKLALTRRGRRKRSEDQIRIAGANLRNLRHVDCEFPVGALTTISGPSGAGKSTLARDVLLESVRTGSPVGCDAIEAPTLRPIVLDQAPLGKNPRSNPATYTKAFDSIRTVFAEATGMPPSAFTFNGDGGCPECGGMGATEISIRLIAPIWVSCEACEGRRYRPEILRQKWSGLSIAEVLACSIEEAVELFAEHASVRRILDTLCDVGLGYITLGQPSPTLSGGEAQRIRLAKQLSKAKSTDLIVLDEPSTGLHPVDLDRIVQLLYRLTDSGATLVVVEHQQEIIDGSDWNIDLGPRGGPDGGQLLWCGHPRKPGREELRPRAEPRTVRRTQDAIAVRGARAHNLRRVDVDFAKGRLTAVTGVSGSGKTSLVNDVLGAEAFRRMLESLSVYERQSVREGPEAPVDSISGLGPTIAVTPELITDRSGAEQATVGRSSDLGRLVALVLARAGVRTCLKCGCERVERESPAADARWVCPECSTHARPVEPRHFLGSPVALCLDCLGLGVKRRLAPEKAVRRPDAPICGGCFGQSTLLDYFCTEGTHGSSSMQAFAARHGFDPSTTPWEDLAPRVQRAFLFGDPIAYPLRPDDDGQIRVADGFGAGDRWKFRGLNHWAIGDVGGSWTTDTPCAACGGKRLRAEYLAVRLGGLDRAQLFSMPFVELKAVLSDLETPNDEVARQASETALHRLRFLVSVGLGYAHLDRLCWTLSAGEAQRLKLASVLGAELVATTVLLDEPTRGLHPSEVTALVRTLGELRDAGNTLIAVEHDPIVIRGADDVIEIGPGSGSAGGRLVDLDSADSQTRRVLDGGVPLPRSARSRRQVDLEMRVLGARANNLRDIDVSFPLGLLIGVCGVSGSGKSTLVIDTLALSLVAPKPNLGGGARAVQSAPGEHDSIVGAPDRVVVADQATAKIASPGMFLGLIPAVRKAFAASEQAREQGITLRDLRYDCDACNGRGAWPEDMWFLPSVVQTCDACDATGYRREIAELTMRGRNLAAIEGLSIAELGHEFGDLDVVCRNTDAAVSLGLGHLTLRQPGWSLSGGEAQRLKLVKGLARRSRSHSLYLLDEPTVGLHASDVVTLGASLNSVVDDGNTVIVVEHDPMLLAMCDWLIEVGPGAGPDGGCVVFEGTPEQLAEASTPTAPYVHEVLG